MGVGEGKLMEVIAFGEAKEAEESWDRWLLTRLSRR